MAQNFEDMKQPVCPHCERVYDIAENESYELYDSDDNHELECPFCEKSFWVHPIAIYRFDTSDENDF